MEKTLKFSNYTHGFRKLNGNWFAIQEKEKKKIKQIPTEEVWPPIRDFTKVFLTLSLKLTSG